MSTTAKAAYGIDAPHVIRNLVLGGLALIILCSIFRTVKIAPVVFILFPGLISGGLLMIFPAVLMLLHSKVGKFKHRDRMLSQISWSGGERALDVGGEETHRWQGDRDRYLESRRFERQQPAES